MGRVVSYYQHTFAEDPTGLNYLKNRGITNNQSLTGFGTGFANATLLNILPEDDQIIKSLKRIGILNNRGKEVFYNCVVFPLYDDKGAVVNLREYLDKVRPWYARKNPKERRIFLLNTGQPMTPASIRSLLFKYRKKARIDKSASPHTMRRSCATHLLQNGADIRYIQKLLGHKHLKTTQCYTKVMPMEVKQTHNKTHPDLKI